MKKTASTNVTSAFVTRHASDVTGVLAGFDRLRLRGTLRALYQPSVLLRYLFVCQVLLKGFKNYAQSLTQRILRGAEDMAKRSNRPSVYLNSARISKEDVARRIARESPVSQGLVAILRCVEPCQTYEVHGIKPILTLAKCMHLYFYEQHPVFGWMHMRLQTWFPFQIEICLNGREWLARQLDKAGVVYQRQDNYFAAIAELPKAQRLMERQAQIQWPTQLGKLLNRNHPLHKEICRPLEWEYYWSCCESEYATDVMFKEPARLAALYPRLVQHALLSFGSRDVLRFLGRNIPLTGNSKFQGQVVTDMKVRPEGLRIKHRVKRNTLKMYDKNGRGIRVETTINECEDFHVFRAPEGRPDQPKKWRPLRRGLADLGRRAEVSKAANQRYLMALASVDENTPLGQLTEKLCRPVWQKGRRYRPLNPWSPTDGALFQAINRGQFAISGLRNRDLRGILFPTPASDQQQRRRAARVSRWLALLRAHGILRKVKGGHRYHMTAKGRTLVTALLTAREASTEQLTKLAA